MRHTQRVKRLERELGAADKELALPIYLDQDATHFTVRWGLWDGPYPKQTRIETFPVEQLEEVVERTDFVGGLPAPVMPGLRFVGDDPEELYDVWERMGVERGTWSWEWRVETYVRGNGNST